MRLFDRVAQSMSDATVHSPDDSVAGWRVSEAVQDANPRFVLDRFASQACADLVRNADGLFDPGSELLRFPAETFWLEMFEEPPEPGDQGECTRFGVLVQTDRSGRSGQICHFWETQEGACRRVPVRTFFDFDHPPTKSSSNEFKLCHGNFGHLAGLLHHTLLRFEERLDDELWFGRRLSRADQLRHIGEWVWFDLPLIAAFTALLNSPGVTETHKSNLERLNSARIRRGRLPLLDHVEVRLVLGARSEAGAGAGSYFGHRATPRLHYVRGHVVRRAGRTFWRSPHLRGSTEKAIVHKIVHVTAAAALRR